MSEIKDPTFREDFPWAWEKEYLPKDWEPQDFVEGSNWIIYYFPGLTGLAYLDFLKAFERDVCSDFKCDESFQLFEYYREEDEYENYLVAVQDNYYYKFDLKEIDSSLMDNESF